MTKELFDYIQNLSLKDKKTLSQKALKVSEETGELAKVVLPFDNAHGTTHRFIEKNRILEESVDVILTAISIAYDLGYSHEDIEDVMRLKAEKWQGIQVKEGKVEYPIPYEIHVTVNIVNNESQINLFKECCKQIGVKPIVLELENSGQIIMNDVMTSSHHFGDNRTAYLECIRISEALESNGFIVVRKKIETVPWHPAAPSSLRDKMPTDCYFEAHIGCIIMKSEEAKLTRILKDQNVHVSVNAFKKLEGNNIVKMITFRKYNGCYDDFEYELECIKSTLFSNNIHFEKVITEFSIYDTRVSHDFKWLEK